MQGIDNNVVGFSEGFASYITKFPFLCSCVFKKQIETQEKMWVMLQCSFFVTTYNMKFDVNTYEILL